MPFIKESTTILLERDESYPRAFIFKWCFQIKYIIVYIIILTMNRIIIKDNP